MTMTRSPSRSRPSRRRNPPVRPSGRKRPGCRSRRTDTPRPTTTTRRRRSSSAVRDVRADLLGLVAPPPRPRAVGDAYPAIPAVPRRRAGRAGARSRPAEPALLRPAHDLQRARQRGGLDVRVHRGEFVDVRRAAAATVSAVAHVRDEVERSALVKHRRRVHEPRVRGFARRVVPFAHLPRVHGHDVVDGEARPGVHLEQVRVEVFVEDHVESQHLEARLRAHPDALRRILQRVAHGAARSLHHPLDPGPQRVHVRAVVHREFLHDGRERSFASVGAAVVFVGSNESLGFFVEGVVCQEALRLVSGRVVGSLVPLRAEPRQALLAEERGEALGAEQQHVQPKVKLQAAEEQRLGQVPLHHVADRGRRVARGGSRRGRGSRTRASSTRASRNRRCRPRR